MHKPLRVLLVEDSVDDAELLELELERGGFIPNILRVETAPAMSKALAEGDWDVVLSDYQLPQFSADGALSTMVAAGKDLPFIILSGVVQAEDAVSLLKHGAHDFLNKDALARLVPAIERELREAVERAQRRQAEERVRILSLAVEQSPVSVVITNRDGIIEYINPRFTSMTGYSQAQAQGRKLDFIRSDMTPDGLSRDLWSAIEEGREWRGELCNQRNDGQPFWEYATISPLKDGNGAITHYIAVKEDISARRSYEERLLRQANFDDLTGLPNRVLMRDRLDQAIAVANRERTMAALLYIDLDRFKNINDSLGHSVGDQLLRAAADKLALCLRAGDTLARMGGDEFVIILPAIHDASAAQWVAERVIDMFSQVFQIDGHDLFVTPSIGITVYPNDGTNQDVLLRNADLAMYKAKDLGRNAYYFFTQEMNVAMRQRLALETQLRGVVGRGELRVFYQPIIDLQTGCLVAVEALVRWAMPNGEICMPTQFIPIAEEMGMIIEIGEWVLSTACCDVQTLPGDVRLAVNVSPRQLQSRGFAAMVERALAESGLPPSQLELEITESVVMDDTWETAVNLKRLEELDIRLSIDDFGTGYSGLAYLQRYPFDTLKIDRSFVSEVLEKPGAARLVETIVAMAHGLGLELIAEGIECDGQHQFLRSLGCDFGQGYLFSRPVPFDGLKLMLRDEVRATIPQRAAAIAGE